MKEKVITDFFFHTCILIFQFFRPTHPYPTLNQIIIAYKNDGTLALSMGIIMSTRSSKNAPSLSMKFRTTTVPHSFSARSSMRQKLKTTVDEPLQRCSQKSSSRVLKPTTVIITVLCSGICSSMILLIMLAPIYFKAYDRCS